MNDSLYYPSVDIIYLDRTETKSYRLRFLLSFLELLKFIEIQYVKATENKYYLCN